MRLWTAQLKPGADPARVALVDDRWRWGAFLAPLLWALWSGLWPAALALLALTAALGAVAAAGGAAAAAALALGLRVALGLEGGALARLDRRLRGWREAGLVEAESEDAAFRRWAEARAA